MKTMANTVDITDMTDDALDALLTSRVRRRTAMDEENEVIARLLNYPRSRTFDMALSQQRAAKGRP
jgi:hypothetical protein